MWIGWFIKVRNPAGELTVNPEAEVNARRALVEIKSLERTDLEDQERTEVEQDIHK